ncbi:hypothetical protein PRIPAC_88858 [Pristionchus pacificus]|uniref:Uncharacterized protein n=1 Tax=Pristionchus pacificus TaxID=54126 RepID=A0A2A6B896_PRIPA|nr:hypothetical protein PRIPAC_88858 [Pristionchus pacificus]|eukprot:PDM62083.1 hypothetical protein PRIPAC_51525 [Pristionchus pacificus]
MPTKTANVKDQVSHPSNLLVPDPSLPLYRTRGDEDPGPAHVTDAEQRDVEGVEAATQFRVQIALSLVEESSLLWKRGHSLSLLWKSAAHFAYIRDSSLFLSHLYSYYKKSTRASTSKAIAIIAARMVKRSLTFVHELTLAHHPNIKPSSAIAYTARGRQNSAKTVFQYNIPSDDERPDFSTANVRVVTKIPAPIMCPTPIIVTSKVFRHRRSSPIDKKSTRASTSNAIAISDARIVKIALSYLCPRVNSRPPSEDQTVLGHCVHCSWQGEERADLHTVFQNDIPSDDERPDFTTANIANHSKTTDSRTESNGLPVVTKIPAPIMCPTPIIVMSKVFRHRRRLVCHPHDQSNPRHQGQLGHHENVDEKGDGGKVHSVLLMCFDEENTTNGDNDADRENGAARLHLRESIGQDRDAWADLASCDDQMNCTTF